MRVTCWKRWQRTKGFICAGLFFGSMGAMPPEFSEDIPTSPMPVPVVSMVLFGLAVALMKNIADTSKVLYGK
jgi:hypothetical protein